MKQNTHLNKFKIIVYNILLCYIIKHNVNEYEQKINFKLEIQIGKRQYTDVHTILKRFKVFY